MCIRRCRLLFGQVFTGLNLVTPYVRQADAKRVQLPFIYNFVALNAHVLHQARSKQLLPYISKSNTSRWPDFDSVQFSH